jgi:abortive infection bacteriophage resistance protein
MEPLKAATTYDEQLAILKKRGTIIVDETFCKQKLEEINYYRFTAYFLPFRNADGTYKEGTSFHTVYRLYEFDRKLRGVLFSAVEEVEIYLRAKFAYFHAHKYGPEGYLLPENFSPKHNAEKFRENIDREIQNNRKALFVKHHIENYNGKFPVWVIIELFTFGMLSRFYEDLTTADKKEIASILYGTTPKNLISWLRCATDLRNICAHYGRLYYRIFPASPAGVAISETAKRRLWGTTLALKSLYPNRNKWNSEVLPALEALFEEYHGDINLYHLAFPQDWKDGLKK